MPPTEPRPPRTSRHLSRNALAVYGTCAALFLTTFGFLGLRAAAGQQTTSGAQASHGAATGSSTATTASVPQSSTLSSVQTATS
ncbi:MAG TPA: hypothetical protein VMT10_15365 [Solirubrobacteraceae bacterium]|nr:hypothetical protein [Solirubrobacteraceae bacterium]